MIQFCGGITMKVALIKPLIKTFAKEIVAGIVEQNHADIRIEFIDIDKAIPDK